MSSPARIGRPLVMTGVVLFVLGALLMLATVVPFFFGSGNQPTALAVGSYAMVVGVLLGLLGLRRDALARRERLRSRLEDRG